MKSPTREPIAIIGIGCRYPGDANTPDTFWQLLCAGIDAISKVPPDRWNHDLFYDDDPSTPGKVYSHWGGFIEGIDQFDAPFFGISRNEAARMDPQQRLLLEVAWEAFEDAGLPAAQIAGTKTGVFVGVARNDYGELQLNPEGREELNAYSTLGLAACMLANRLSHFFDLRGPSFPLDTACSSSLAAVSLACQSIWQGESTMALAGGVNVILKPEVNIGMSRAFMLATDGRCKPFDAAADGYSRGEGVGLVVLKPLAQAEADGDPIYAVIRGCAINYDGHTAEINVPDGAAQQEVLRTVCRQAGISPEQIQYIEAQGSGSFIGDAVEANALGALVSAKRAADDPCYIGSVKSNIGHAEAAAGISGLIKAALALKHEQIPPNLHFQTPNPQIPFAELGLHVPTELLPWPTPAADTLRFACVNAFGIGGANAHVLLSEAPRTSVQAALRPTSEDGALLKRYLFPLSAHTPQALHALAARLREFVEHSAVHITLANICYSAALCRSHHAQRLALLVSSKVDLIEQLKWALFENGSSGERGNYRFQANRTVGAIGEDTAAAMLPNNVDPALIALQQAYLAGEEVDFAAHYPAASSFVRLPTYPWQHKRYWHESEASANARLRGPMATVEAVNSVEDSRQKEPVEDGIAKSVPVTERAAPESLTPLSPFLQELAQHHDVRERLAAYLTSVVADVLDLETTAVTPEQGFFDMGFSSLQAIDLLNRLNQRMGLTLHTTATFKYPTITALVDYLLTDVMRVEQPTSTRAKPAVRTEIRTSIDRLAEPIAIVGMGCRFPGAENPAAFWELLASGRDAVTEIPADRWPVDAFYHADLEVSGSIYTRSGGFLSQIDRFDPQFFGISPREAEEMDPHQWLLLEVCWEALEQAGIAPDQLRNQLAGIFLGMCADDHLQASGTVATNEIGPYAVLGNARSVAAGRIAYLLGAQGPAIQLDTACSSSLVALHYACQSLRLGEADLALAGGVNLMLTPRNTVALCQMKALSPDGRCKAFDAAADGYGRGEGCGIVVLKRLADAEREGDPILALVRGSAVNHDGPSSGLTVPNEQAQEALLRQTLRVAGVVPGEVSYIETHGTGTPLGDPIEVNAIAAVYGERTQPLTLGAVKSNIGHLEAAAGIAGVIKVVLAMQHGEIPPQLHLDTPNPYIPWERLPIQVPSQLQPWTEERRLAGCSAFGFSGTNAHVLLESAPTQSPTNADGEGPDRLRHLLTLSAKTPSALHALAATVADSLDAMSTTAKALADAAFTANTGRAQFRRRLALSATTPQEAAIALRRFAANQNAANLLTGNVWPGQQPKVAFLFTGQGAQTVGMGQELYATEPRFRDALDQCDAILQPLLGTSIVDVIFGRETQQARALTLSDTIYTQPALFAVEYALAKLWQSWGIAPTMVMGHSIGEYVAACLAGAFTLEEGLQLVAARGRLMQALPKNGAMAAIFAPEAMVTAAIAPHADTVAIAAVNGPQNTVIAGEAEAIHAALITLEAEGIDTKPLQVSHAFHSPLIEPMLDEFEAIAGHYQFRSLRLPLISNLTGAVLPPGTLLDARYWREHTRNAVRFTDGVATLLNTGHTHFLEIGPRPILSTLGREIVENNAQPTTWLPSLKHGADGWQTMLESLATLYVDGVTVDWIAFEQAYQRQRVSLPTYPFQRTFQRKPYWSAEDRNFMNGHRMLEQSTNGPAPQSRNGQLAAGLQAIIGETLKLEPTTIEVDIPLIELGADSLGLINAVRTIERAYGVKISVRQFFEELSTVAALAGYLDQQLPAEWGTALPQNNAVASTESMVNNGTNGVSGPRAHHGTHTGNGMNSNGMNGNGSHHHVYPPAQPTPLPMAPAVITPPAMQTTLPPVPAATYQPTAPASDAGERERVINAQLQLLGQLMTQQLNVLQSSNTASSIQAYVAQPPPQPLPQPSPQPSLPPAEIVAASAHQPAVNGHTHTTIHDQQPVVHNQQPVAVEKPKAQPQAVGPWRPAQTQKSALTPRQQAHLDALIARYNERTRTSKTLTQQYRPVLADSRVAVGFRASIKEMIYPVMGERAEGAYFWDVDGNRYIDMTMGFGTLLFGHTPPFLQQALTAQHQSGMELGPQLKITGEVAELFCELTGMERVTFCNSGTEAVMAAIRLARAATGRTKIVHFGGAYHGHSDMTLGMATDGNANPRAMTFFPGIPENILADALVLEYGNMESLAIIREHAHELAAVLVEPIQSRHPELQPVEFVHALRKLTEETGIVLIFDEMITGLRIHPGGAQAWFGIQADLATYGKIAGGGMPIGIVAGKASIMNYIDGGVWDYGDDSYPSKETIFFGGTFCKHPLAMATAKAALTQIKALGMKPYEELNQRTANFAEELNRYFTEENVPIKVVYWGSLFLFRFQSNLEIFFFHLLEKGIFMWEWRNCFLSMAHTDEDIAYMIQAVKETVEELRSGDFLASASGGKDAPHGGNDGLIEDLSTPSYPPPNWGRIGGGNTRTIDFSLYYFGLYRADYAPGKYDLLFAGTRYADEHGFSAVWVPERHFHEFGGFSPNPSVLCAALARASSRVQLRAGSVVLPIHHPVRIVEEWSVVDNLSNGRVGLAAASGWHPNDFIFAPENFGKHRDLTFATIETVRKLWRGEAMSFPNGAGNTTTVNVYPLPVQKEIPLYLTIVNNPDTYEKAGELGVGILTNLMGQSLDELAQNIERYRAARTAAGHDPATGEVAVLLHTFVSDDLSHAQEVARQPLCDYFRSTIGLFKSMTENMGLENNFDELSQEQQDEFLNLVYEHYIEERALIGTPESCAVIVEKLHKLGVTEIACFVDAGIDDALVEAHFPQMNALRELCQARLSQMQSETDVDSPQATPPQPSPIWGRLGGGETAPATAAQQQLWLMAQLGETESLAYNEFVTVTLRGSLHLPSLQRALDQVVARHEALRTTFSADGTMQIIHPAAPVALPIVDYSELATAECEEALAQWLRTEGECAFDLYQGPLFTAHLLKVSATEHLLALKAHHSILDGWSFTVLLGELITCYNGAYGGVATSLPTPMSFSEFAQVQHAHRDSETMRLHADYWQNQFATPPPQLDLPTDRSRPPQPTYPATRQSLTLATKLVADLKAFSRTQRSTLFMTLFAAYTTLLHRLTNQKDLVVGTPVSGRFNSASEVMIGYGTHLLPLRVQIDPAATFAQHLAITRKLILDGFEHEAYPFAWLLEELQAASQSGRAPLIRTAFNMDQPVDLPTSYGLAVDVAWQPRQAVPFELTLNAIEVDGALQLDCDYNTDLFDAATIIRWLGHFQTLLEAVIAQPDQPILELPLLTDAEYHQIVHEWNDTFVDFGEPQTIHALFEQQVTQTPDAVAVVFEQEQLTYHELNCRANQLAYYLIDLGVRADTLVAIAMERSIAMVVSLLAVLKAGGAYVPVDPTYPAERVRYMLKDSAAPILLTQSHLSAIEMSTSHSTHTVAVDTMAAKLASQPTENPHTRTFIDDLAYVIYTSGSTGYPKGVLIEHGGAFNVAMAQAAVLPDLTTGSRLLQLASLGFDAATAEIMMALMHGVTLVVTPADHERVGSALADLLQVQRITHVTLVPSILQTLPKVDLPELKVLITAGEACPPKLVNQWRGKRHFFNFYGPTESPIWTTYASLQPEQPVHIGQPIPNRQVYILNDVGRIAPTGVAGELHIGGRQLARGYLNRPDLTTERFINHAQFGQLYKTGDLCRWLPDGNIEYIGRTDFQVKIRGFRIELGEIEAILNQHTAVQESVVLVRDEADEKRLVAYLVAGVADDVNPATLRDHLRRHLPEYMVPATFIWIDAIPLTANGKVDRRALAEMAQDESLWTEPIVPPTTPTQVTLIAIWAEVLAHMVDQMQIGIHNNFFELGGQSLLVARLVGRINAEFEIELSMRSLFELPTVALLAERIDLLKTVQRLQSTPEADVALGSEDAAPREEILL